VATECNVGGEGIVVWVSREGGGRINVPGSMYNECG